MESLKNYIINNDPNHNEIFVIVKPGFLKLSDKIIKRIQEDDFKLVKSRTKFLTLNEAKELYKIHKDEDWYEPLCKYMSNDLSLGLLFRYKNNNPFEPMSSIKDEIRKEWGESDMRNVMHSSDSYENMLNEQCIYFG